MNIRRTSSRLVLAATLSLGMVPMAMGVAFADPGSNNGKAAHWNQNDGCQHGNSGKPCKDDPQPDKGKDCLKHGNWGGINEDHCAVPDSSDGGDI